MSISISSEDGQRLDVNAWNWGVLHFVVEKAKLFPQDVWEPARYLGTNLDSGQVKLLADFLEANVLAERKAGQRMFFGGTKTDLPDDGTFFREPDEQWKNYSLHQDVLLSILHFCETPVAQCRSTSWLARPNPSVKGTVASGLCPLATVPYVERCAS